MLCIRAAYAVVRCLFVRLSVRRPSATFVYSVETHKHNFERLFKHRVATQLFFHTKSYGNILTGTLPLTGASNAGWYEKIHIFVQCLASSRVVIGATVTCHKHGAAGTWQVCDTHRW